MSAELLRQIDQWNARGMMPTSGNDEPWLREGAALLVLARAALSHGAEPAKGADAPIPRELVEALIDRCMYPDSLGVYGSDFTGCHICQGSSGPGIYARKDWHAPDCPVPAVERALRASPIKAEVTLSKGWICPACGHSNAPTNRECACRGNKTLRERIHTP